MHHVLLLSYKLHLMKFSLLLVDVLYMVFLGLRTSIHYNGIDHTTIAVDIANGILYFNGCASCVLSPPTIALRVGNMGS